MGRGSSLCCSVPCSDTEVEQPPPPALDAGGCPPPPPVAPRGWVPPPPDHDPPPPVTFLLTETTVTPSPVATPVVGTVGRGPCLARRVPARAPPSAKGPSPLSTAGTQTALPGPLRTQESASMGLRVPKKKSGTPGTSYPPPQPTPLCTLGGGAVAEPPSPPPAGSSSTGLTLRVSVTKNMVCMLKGGGGGNASSDTFPPPLPPTPSSCSALLFHSTAFCPQHSVLPPHAVLHPLQLPGTCPEGGGQLEHWGGVPTCPPSPC